MFHCVILSLSDNNGSVFNEMLCFRSFWSRLFIFVKLNNADMMMRVFKIIIPIFRFQILRTLMIIWKMMNMMKIVNPLRTVETS